MERVVLRKGRERSVLKGHPWVFSGAIIAEAVGRRAAFYADDAVTAIRLVNAENDLIPGVVADCYAGHVVCQFTSAGADARKEEIADALMKFAPFCQAVRRRFPRQGGACDGAGIQGSPRCRAAGAGGDRRERREVSRRRETRPQDRLLLGPARRTCRGRCACEWCRRPQLLLLFRRLRALCPCLRRRVRDAGRHLRRCACAREEKRGLAALLRHEDGVCRSRCVPVPQEVPRCGAEVRPRRRGSS